MSLFQTAFTAIGKLAVVAILLAAFLASMAGVVYMSLSGEEITVPEITGKDYFESEKELAALGLKIKRRADRPSTEKMNTVLEQLPKPGETVKTGQLIFVVVAKAGADGEEAPKSLIKDLETDDTQKIEEMISEKPKKAKPTSNSNTKKKAETTRDVEADESDSDQDDKPDPKADNSNKKSTDDVKEPVEKGNKNTSTQPAARTQTPPAKPAPKPTVKETKPRN